MDLHGIAARIAASQIVAESKTQMINEAFESWPQYVIQDLIIPMIKTTDPKKVPQAIQEVKQSFPIKSWKLVMLPIKLESFDQKTQDKLKQRLKGDNPDSVPDDQARHEFQQQKIKNKGVSGEPMIVLKNQDGLELLEGWHRTIQHLKAFPDGYKGPAWVGVE